MDELKKAFNYSGFKKKKKDVHPLSCSTSRGLVS